MLRLYNLAWNQKFTTADFTILEIYERSEPYRIIRREAVFNGAYCFLIKNLYKESLFSRVILDSATFSDITEAIDVISSSTTCFNLNSVLHFLV